ncbi:MAG: CocE/NonD family hydrolase [Gammaproteobacteria bacterium]
MRIVDEFPRAVRTRENVWIPMPDGVRLAARVWLPEGAEENPVPAVLEYIPYRKRDSTRSRDEQIYPYFAGHGYAGVRVDIRGSGDSDGLLRDEYLKQELDDGISILRWLEQQPWCNGRVGIMGISWGGFNGLQIAAMRPPQLKAIITVCSTDDRYADDVHHMGGCLLGDNLSWASTMFAYNSCPPDPDVVGEGWRDTWMQRLRGGNLWLEQWLQHQRRDAYWKHGSICEDYDAIQCPVMAVSGWADGYSNAVFRLLANLNVPRQGLIGPWGHKYPHIGVPGPAIGFLQEAVRWWDRWLKESDNGVDEDPMLRVWMQESVPPTTRYRIRPGRWVAERSWPAADIEQREFILGPARQLLPLESRPAQEIRNLQSPLGLGLFAGKWCSYTAAPDLPHDQRQEDGGALVYDSEPLEQALEILGAPHVELEIIPDKPVALLAVRLSDIAPDNKATRVSYGLLNLTHRESSEKPERLEPGKQYRVRVQLNYIAQAFPEGHRLRIAVSTSYWPLAWPAPESAQVKVIAGPSRAYLPVRAVKAEDGDLRPFGEPETAPPLATTMIEPESHDWRVIRDLDTDISTLEVINDGGIVYIKEIDLELGRKALEWYTYRGDDFNSVRGETVWERSFKRRDWQIKTITRTVLTSTATDFHLRAELDAYEGDKRVYSQNWDHVIPRDFV